MAARWPRVGGRVFPTKQKRTSQNCTPAGQTATPKDICQKAPEPCGFSKHSMRKYPEHTTLFFLRAWARIEHAKELAFHRKMCKEGVFDRYPTVKKWRDLETLFNNLTEEEYLDILKRKKEP